MIDRSRSVSFSFARALKVLGPSLLMAGAAIGVSHLVQSIRAGASYGMWMVWVVLVANVLKYPFFQAGHRYVLATGDNLLVGYMKLGKAYLWVFFLLNIVTALGSIAGVSFVTGALASYLFSGGSLLGSQVWTLVILAICMTMVVVGRYRLVERIIKVKMAVLFLATMAAFFGAVAHGSVAPADFVPPEIQSQVLIGFLVALVGWMPAPIELSVWNSLWLQAKQRNLTEKPSAREVMFDFNFGYVLTTVLAMVFVSLGALVMYGSGETPSALATVFCRQLVGLYTQVLGNGWGPIIGAAAFSTMFSTTLTVMDVYPRSMAVALQILVPQFESSGRRLHITFMGIGFMVSAGIVLAYLTSLGKLIDVVTTVAFLSAPVFAFLNLRLLSDTHLDKDFRFGKVMKGFAWFGLLLFTGFAGVFVYVRFLAA